MTLRYLFLVVSVAFQAGCAPWKILPAPPAWPVEREGRKLYPTPRGLIYATSPGAAGWLDRYLEDRLPRIGREFGVAPGPGVFVAIGPDDPPMTGVTPWPVCREPGMGSAPLVVTFPDGPPSALGFVPPDGSPYRWSCALPTDAFNAESFDYSFNYLLREHPVYTILVHGWFMLLFGPAGRAYSLDYAANERDYGLARASLDATDLSAEPREALRLRIQTFYDGQRAAIQRRYAPWLLD